MAEATREAYGKALAKLIVDNKKVIVLDADLTKSTGTIEARKVCPQRHFNMGIAEANMMGVAAGLAASNKIVYASSFAVFAAGRAFDQIRNSICYPNLNVKICATHAGISVGEDGASHQAIEDIAIMRCLPNMKVIQPCDARETEAVIRAVAEIEGPCYIRLGRLRVEDVYDDSYTFVYGKGMVLHKGSQIAIITSGLMVQESMKAVAQMDNIDPTIINIHTIKPIDKKLIIETAKTHKIILTIEEHNVIGGLGSAVAEVLASSGLLCQHYIFGIYDEFGRSGKPEDLLDYYKLNAKHIASYIHQLINKIVL